MSHLHPFRSLATAALLITSSSMLKPALLPAAPEPAAIAKEISDVYGMELQENTAGRVVVSRVLAGSPAAVAEIKVNDVIVGVDDSAVLSIKTLAKYLRDKPVGEPATFAIDRLGKKLVFPLKAALVKKAQVLPPGKETGLLGMFLIEDSEGRARVSSVTPGSPADKAGIVKGDRIAVIGDHVPMSYRDMINFTVKHLDTKKAGDELSVRLLRGDTQEEVLIVVPERAVVRPPVVEAVEPSTELKHGIAVAVVQPFAQQSLTGFIRFASNPDGVAVSARLQGLKPGRYRLTIHEFGDPGDLEHQSAGGVLGVVTNEAGEAVRPVGDLGPIEPDALGDVHVVREVPGLRIDLPHSILGRLVTIDRLPTTPDAPVLIEGYGVIGIGHPRRLQEAAAVP